MNATHSLGQASKLRIAQCGFGVCSSGAAQALKAGADEALMLDPQGFLATCNSTNFFAVRKGEVRTHLSRRCCDLEGGGAYQRAAPSLLVCMGLGQARHGCMGQRAPS